MSALNDFVVAAGSYFGMPEGRVMHGSTIDTKDGQLTLVLRIDLTTDDVVGIGKRVGVLLAQAESDARVEDMEPILPSREALRAQYNSLPASQRSAFGSFHKYVVAYDAGYEPPQGWAADSEPKGPAVIPAHVWVPGSELTGPQLAMAMSMDEQGRYAMDPADLTSEQRKRLGVVLDGPGQ